jgi:hypothetical protein
VNNIKEAGSQHLNNENVKELWRKEQQNYQEMGTPLQVLQRNTQNYALILFHEL